MLRIEGQGEHINKGITSHLGDRMHVLTALGSRQLRGREVK